MAAPDYVPVLPHDRPREPERMRPPDHWTATRPGDFVQQKAAQPVGRRLGNPGPDLGYALLLAHRFDDRLRLTAGEQRDDAVAGCVEVAMKRASLFGRAPVIYDLELAFDLFGFLSDRPPADLVAERRSLFAAASHHYEFRRAIADRVPEATLRLSPADVAERAGAGDWRALLTAA